MDEQKELQWILIRRFIEILFLVGVTEYLLMSVLNNLALPVVYDYFFPHQERNLTYGNRLPIACIIRSPNVTSSSSSICAFP